MKVEIEQIDANHFQTSVTLEEGEDPPTEAELEAYLQDYVARKMLTKVGFI